jgi:hypothetical protein
MFKTLSKIIILFILLSSFPAHTFLGSDQNDPLGPGWIQKNPRLPVNYSKFPPGFAQNRDEDPGIVLVYGRPSGFAAQQTKGTDELLQFTAGGHVLGFRIGEIFIASGDHTLKVEYVKARPVSPVEEAKPTGSGNNRQTAQPLGKVTSRDLWDGVTLVYERHGSGVAKSTYYVQPEGAGAIDSVERIRIRYNVPMNVDRNGDLILSFAAGEMRESWPVAW